MNDEYKSFIRGFQIATELTFTDAEEQWAGFSRQLNDAERREIESGGEASGRVEGKRFLELYPN